MKNIESFIEDMIQAIESIESYKVSSYESFLDDDRTQDAIMYNIIILGEAANQIKSEFKLIHPEIPWASMIGTRNVIVHGYDQVKLQIVWDIVTKDLHSLKEKLNSLL